MLIMLILKIAASLPFICLSPWQGCPKYGLLMMMRALKLVNFHFHFQVYRPNTMPANLREKNTLALKLKLLTSKQM